MCCVINFAALYNFYVVFIRSFPAIEILVKHRTRVRQKTFLSIRRRRTFIAIIFKQTESDAFTAALT